MVIKLYDIDNNKFVYNVGKPIDSGSTANVYRITDDTCLKYIPASSMYDYSIIEKIMELDLPNFYKIYKILFEYPGCFSGYLMKYYQKEKINILTMPTDYTLDNFYKISKAINILTDNAIVARDMHSGNVVMDKNNITIIDIDYFDFEYGLKDEVIKRNNYRCLMNLFYELYKEELCFYDGDLINATKVIINLFSPFQEERMFYKKLDGYKYPIDYIKCKVKKKQY